jgi:hypothetical protein
MASAVITSSSWRPVLPPWPMYAAVFMYITHSNTPLLHT